MNSPLCSQEGKEKKPYVRPAFEVHNPLPPDFGDRSTLQRLRKTIIKLLPRFQDDAYERMHAYELAAEIIEFGRMRGYGKTSFIIEVPLVAYHLREKSSHVKKSLRLLEMKGIAERTPSKNHWRLVA